MGIQELLETLKKNEQKQIEDIWQAARAEAENLRQQVDKAIDAVSKEHAEQLAAACQRSRRSITSEAENETRSKKLFAYQSLEQALFNAAVKKLPLLRDQQYEKVFATLVQELPENNWEEIIVNPGDCELAAQFFPNEIIRSDKDVSGGLVAATAAGRITVDNTFAKRLERQWFRILPCLIEDIEKQYAEKESAAKT